MVVTFLFRCGRPLSLFSQRARVVSTTTNIKDLAAAMKPAYLVQDELPPMAQPSFDLVSALEQHDKSTQAFCLLPVTVKPFEL